MDCLVTKLDASVNNNLMEHFGKIYIYANGYVQMVFNGAGSYTIKHSDSSENTYQYSSGDTKAVNEQGATVIINNKYTLEKLEGSIANYYFCLNDFKSVPVQVLKSVNENVNGDIDSLVDCQLTTLFLQNCYGVTGNIESIGKQTSLVSCEVYSTVKNMKIEGDIVSIAPCSALTTLNLINCNIKGVVEAFVKEQMQAGRTSGTLVFKENNRNVYFNAKSSGGLHEFTITYSATGAIVTCDDAKGETIDTGTYVLATDTWTYE